jgi:hypothetical protein
MDKQGDKMGMLVDELRSLGILSERVREHFEVQTRRLMNYGFSKEDAILFLEDMKYWILKDEEYKNAEEPN